MATSKQTSSLQLAGLNSFLRVLDELGGNIATRIANAATKEGGQIVLAAARANLITNPSIESGALLSSLATRHRYYRKSKTAVAITGVDTGFATEFGGRPRKPFKYAHLVEKGTAIHAIGNGSRIRGKRHRRIGPRGDMETYFDPGPQKGRLHPGAKPEPFLRPAIDQNRQAIAQAIERISRERLDKEARKLAAKQFREAAAEETRIKLAQPFYSKQAFIRPGVAGYAVSGGGKAYGVARSSSYERSVRREFALAARAAGGSLPRRR